QSIWIDASFIINTNLDEWWNKYFRKGFSAARHPLRDCLYKEGEHCIRTRRGSEGVAAQLSAYRNAGHPRRSGLITSGLIMRENSPEVIALCNAWWSELQLYSIRDQVAFAKVAYKSDIVFTYDWNYIANNHFLYKKHFHLR
ncbi:MAG TPA: glycosyltransferase domain-containing protein, partial [Candidatus Babeliaceae bacterium]|nr:glycosyltransferase domain-containing protein [Candidatus Babeliaceae bacterium]